MSGKTRLILYFQNNMPIYKVDKDMLTHIREQKIEFERDIQRLTEKNLDTLLGLEFVSTEFSLHQL
jgi:hypothetical protein